MEAKKHKPRKSLGQNFLKSEIALRKLVEAGEVTKDDTILEIGPGKGAITRKLLRYAGRVIAVEKDPYLVSFLREKFSDEVASGQLILVENDILDFEISKAFPEVFEWSGRGAGPRRTEDLRKNSEKRAYKIIANIPYNITGAILKKFLTETHQPSLMVLLVQHEVAKRIVARDKKESILSISVKSYGKPSMIDKVPARYFSPSPKVDSAIIKIADISRDFFIKNEVDEEKFWEIVKKGFAHKRKKLSGNLKNAFSDEKKINKELGDKRAEDITLLDWIFLAK